LDALLLAIGEDLLSVGEGRSPEIRESVGRVLLHAADTFGSAEKAELWLRRPNVLLGAPPLQLVFDSPEAVDAELTRVDHGVYA
jgi:uncharacterized protein (DUF2384 family)